MLNLVSNRHKWVIDDQCSATLILMPKFTVRVLVLLFKAAHKLYFTWSEPHQVVAVTSPAVWVLEDQIIQNTEKIHVAHSKGYYGAAAGKEALADVLDLASRITAEYEVLSKIMDKQKHERRFSDDTACTSNVISCVHQPRTSKKAISDVARDFLNKMKKKKLALSTAQHLSIQL